LLLAADKGIEEAALTRLPPPAGADRTFWSSWLQDRAKKFPFVWPNHRDAIAKGFHQIGKSAVVILPTGAGKTTASSLKIAGALARRKKVVFLAPTHALVEQLTEDLQEMFPKSLLGSVVSSDFDLLFLADTQFQEIEVMTPERCLAMLSFAPDAFSDVGLLVFDECHLLSPQSGKIRRALDGMLCILAFNRVVPGADMLFLSAMLKNGADFAAWIGDLTGRECVDVDLLWKPSRQVSTFTHIDGLASTPIEGRRGVSGPCAQPREWAAALAAVKERPGSTEPASRSARGPSLTAAARVGAERLRSGRK
jgi:hypothetical protein